MATAEDDLFASLGDSLMRDLLTDIAGPESLSTENDMLNLANLEKELDATTPSGNVNVHGNSNSNSGNINIAPPPPGLANLSAGAMVVNAVGGNPNPHNNPPPPMTPGQNATTGTHNHNQDAFAQSLQQFSALSLTEDFLKADSARKELNNNMSSVKLNQHGEKMSNDLVNNLFEGEEDYDVKEDAVLSAGSDKAMAQLFPGFGKQGVAISAATKNGASTATATGIATGSGMPSQQGVGMGPGAKGPPLPMPQSSPMPGMPPPPNMREGHLNPNRGQTHPPPPQMMRGMPMPPPPNQMPQGMRPPPHMMAPMNMPPGAMPPGNFPPGAMPPGNMPPPHVMMMMQQQMQHQQMQQQHHMQRQQMQMQQQLQIQQQQQQQQQHQKQQKQVRDNENKKVFKKMDFPALGADASEIEKERMEEAKVEKEAEKERKKALASTKRVAPSAPMPIIRYTFHNPSPSAPPVPASAIKCTSMTSRDLCYVLHSMLRPILSFASILDAYNADYYRWSYDDRKSRNLLFLGGSAPSSGNNLPNPVWKETKEKAQKMEDKFRQTVEKRANEWTKEKQTLGKISKVNVKRPRALLSTTALSSTAESKVDSSVTDTEEDRQRTVLWAARVAIDKGFQAYLNLVELRRLLQSRPGDALNGEESIINRREELLKDVEENVSKLEGAFGVKKGDSGIECDDKILARTLTLPKGRMLLSRVIDEGILPHPSACKVLPTAIKVIFASASTADLSGAPPAGEDRLLRSLTGLVKTAQPSVDPSNLLLCLSSTINAENIINGEKRSMKSVLTNKRTLMELLYAIFSRGGEVCIGGFEAAWKDKESKFLGILSAS